MGKIDFSIVFAGISLAVCELIFLWLGRPKGQNIWPKGKDKKK